MIRNYEYPEGTISTVDANWATTPVFISSTTGGPIAGGVTGRTNAVTTIALCNTAAPDPANETTNEVTVNIYIVRSGKSYGSGNKIVSSLNIPAGETVFFSEERIVLENGDSIVVEPSVNNVVSVTVSALAV
jgi:hypothetical protein